MAYKFQRGRNSTFTINLRAWGGDYHLLEFIKYLTFRKSILNNGTLTENQRSTAEEQRLED